MRSRALPVVGAMTMIFWLSACGVDGPGAAPPTASDVLTVTCTQTTTSVDVTDVAAGPSGVSVRLVDQSDSGLVGFMESEATERGVYVERDDSHVELAPDAYFVRCVSMDEPEHMEPARDSAESQQIQVLAAPNDWIPQHEPSCEVRSSSVRDYAEMDEPDPDRRDDPVEPVVRADRDIARWLLDGDRLVSTGYRDAEGRRIEVVRGGNLVGVVTLSLGPDGWFITTTDLCSTS